MTEPSPEIVPLAMHGRVHRTTRQVRLGDVHTDGRARLDAIARYLQDAGNDDTADAGVGNGGAWVTRRVVAEIEGDLPEYLDDVETATFCGGYGKLVVERRTDVTHSRGRIRTATIWAYLDAARMRPAPIPEWFHSIYADTAAGRVVRGKLSLPAPPPDAATRLFALRVSDFDVLKHVNNAIAWAIIEDELAARGVVGRVRRVVIEYPGAIDDGTTDVRVRSELDGDVMRMWVSSDDIVRVAAEVAFTR